MHFAQWADTQLNRQIQYSEHIYSSIKVETRLEETAKTICLIQNELLQQQQQFVYDLPCKMINYDHMITITVNIHTYT